MTLSSGTKPDLLLLHGALGSREQFHELQIIARENFNTHVLNFTGHGGSDIPVTGYSMDLFEKDINDYLEANKLREVYIFGYSMGGYVALSFTHRNPHKVKAIFTLATKFNWTPETATREASMLDPEIMQQKIPQFTDKLAKLHYPADWKKVVSETASFMINLGNDPMTEKDFRSVTCPVICSVGDKDKMVSREETKRVAEWIPEGRSIILTNTPHPLEACDFASLHKLFLDFFMKEKV